MELQNVYAYYDPKTEKILDFLPHDLDDTIKANIINFWSQEIPKRILRVLSEHESMTAPRIKEEIGHSMSTLHENIKKLHDAGLIETKMIYEGNKQKVISPKVYFVTQNPTFTRVIKKAVNQGVWVDTEKTKKILSYMEENEGKFLSAEDVSRKLKIPVDEVATLLENWNSQFNRGISDFLKKKPFERRVFYRFIKER